MGHRICGVLTRRGRRDCRGHHRPRAQLVRGARGAPPRTELPVLTALRAPAPGTQRGGCPPTVYLQPRLFLGGPALDRCGARKGTGPAPLGWASRAPRCSNSGQPTRDPLSRHSKSAVGLLPHTRLHSRAINHILTPASTHGTPRCARTVQGRRPRAQRRPPSRILTSRQPCSAAGILCPATHRQLPAVRAHDLAEPCRAASKHARVAPPLCRAGIHPQRSMVHQARAFIAIEARAAVRGALEWMMRCCDATPYREGGPFEK
mmetsp:Transcript_6875/g.19968  ORF Transcript_6875/g.19968 Transcript_6875/m.19968 type:complete len:262 (-) Transcript_6875:32-817(-)